MRERAPALAKVTEVIVLELDPIGGDRRFQILSRENDGPQPSADHAPSVDVTIDAAWPGQFV